MAKPWEGLGSPHLFGCTFSAGLEQCPQGAAALKLLRVLRDQPAAHSGMGSMAGMQRPHQHLPNPWWVWTHSFQQTQTRPAGSSWRRVEKDELSAICVSGWHCGASKGKAEALFQEDKTLNFCSQFMCPHCPQLPRPGAHDGLCPDCRFPHRCSQRCAAVRPEVHFFIPWSFGLWKKGDRNITDLPEATPGM